MIKDIYRKYILVGAGRSVLIKKNILYLTILRIISALCGFLIVPLTINYVSSSKYGIWLTINSIVGWFGILDLGLSNGFRNKFTECLAKGEDELGRCYLSSTIAMNIVIISLFFIFFLIANQYLNWTKILNTSPDDFYEIKITILLTTLFFCLRFIFNILNFLLVADQKPALSNLLDTTSSIISLLVIFILTKTIPASLINLSLSLNAIPVIVLILASIYFFSKKYRIFIPSVKYVRFKYLKGVFGLGIKFFIIQISVLFTLALNNVLFSHFFSPETVTEYNIAYKYLSITTMITAIISAPIWSATTDAYAKNDIQWIKNAYKKYMFCFLFITLLIIIQVLISGEFYFLWIGKDTKISLIMTVFVSLYTNIYNFNILFGNFIYGTGKVNTIFIFALIGLALYYPVIYLSLNIFHFGIISIILGNIIFLLPTTIAIPIIFYNIFYKYRKYNLSKLFD